MKLLLANLILFVSAISFAAVSPLKFVEKSSYRLSALTKQGAVDKSFLSETFRATVKGNSQGGAEVILFSSSPNESEPNQVVMTFDSAAKMISASTKFTAANPAKTIFPKANADELLDVGPEYILDHLKDSPDHVVVAEKTQELRFVNDAGKIKMDIYLNDGRLYQVVMDVDGKLLSKGMKP